MMFAVTGGYGHEMMVLVVVVMMIVGMLSRFNLRKQNSTRES